MILIQFFVVCEILCVIGSVTSIIVRVRSLDGSIQRLDVDDSTSTSGLLNRFRDLGFFSSKSSNPRFIIKNQCYTSTTDDISLESLQVSSGELIILEDDKITDERTEKEPSQVKKALEKSVRKRVKPSSVSDLRKSRQALVKITQGKRERGTRSDSVVSVSPNSGRILKRISHGGFGVLLGRIVKHRAKYSRRKKSSDDHSVNLEVSAICEVFSCSSERPDEPMSWDVINKRKESLEDIRQLAMSLNLTVVGCVVGMPLARQALPWSSYHVYALLQLQEYFQDKGLILLR